MVFFHFDIWPTHINKVLLTKSTISTKNRERALVGRDGEYLRKLQWKADLELGWENVFFVPLNFVSVISMARSRFLSDGSAG